MEIKKIEAWFETILKIPINELFKNHIETANTTIGDQTIRTVHKANTHTHIHKKKINWELEVGGEKSNVQIPKINTLFIWIFYKIPIKTNKQKPLSSLCKYVQAKVVRFLFLCKICGKIFFLCVSSKTIFRH